MITNILVAIMLGQSAFVAPDEGQPLTFNFVRESLVVIPVYLNGRGPYRFLLDTGATHSILSGSLAGELNVPAGKSGFLITAGGNVAVSVVTIETIQIGSLRINQAQIAVTRADLLHELHLDGIIGADYLKQFKISIDYTHRLLSIKP
jgi:predicted aspartyl protease